MTAIDSLLSKMIHVRMGKKLLVVLRCECFCFFWNMLSNLPQYFSPGLASSTISLWPPQQPAKKPPMFLFFFLVEKVINCPRKIVLSQVWRRKADNWFAIVSDSFFFKPNCWIVWKKHFYSKMTIFTYLSKKQCLPACCCCGGACVTAGGKAPPGGAGPLPPPPPAVPITWEMMSTWKRYFN